MTVEQMFHSNSIQISSLTHSHLITYHVFNQRSIKSVCDASVQTHVGGTHVLISLSKPQSTSCSVAAACFRKIQHKFVRNALRIGQYY